MITRRFINWHDLFVKAKHNITRSPIRIGKITTVIVAKPCSDRTRQTYKKLTLSYIHILLHLNKYELACSDPTLYIIWKAKHLLVQKQNCLGHCKSVPISKKKTIFLRNNACLNKLLTVYSFRNFIYICPALHYVGT